LFNDTDESREGVRAFTDDRQPVYSKYRARASR
jgi:1,4-dihydroxy-2-naphthoyl-CoA synthase